MALHQTITIERERVEQYRRLLTVSDSLQKTIAALQDIEELQELPRDLADITTDWLQQIIDACTAPIKEDKSLTSDERRERLKHWKAINQRARRLVDTIAGILDANPDVVFSVEEDEAGQLRYFLHEPQIEALARQRATHDVPPEALEHLEYIDKTKEAIEALREWEAGHNVRPIPIAELTRTTWDGLANLWISGDIFTDPLTEKYSKLFPGVLRVFDRQKIKIGK